MKSKLATVFGILALAVLSTCYAVWITPDESLVTVKTQHIKTMKLKPSANRLYQKREDNQTSLRGTDLMPDTTTTVYNQVNIKLGYQTMDNQVSLDFVPVSSTDNRYHTVDVNKVYQRKKDYRKIFYVMHVVFYAKRTDYLAVDGNFNNLKSDAPSDI